MSRIGSISSRNHAIRRNRRKQREKNEAKVKQENAVIKNETSAKAVSPAKDLVDKYFDESISQTKHDIKRVQESFENEGATPAVLDGISGTANLGKNIIKGVQTAGDVVFEQTRTDNSGFDNVVSNGIGKTASGIIGTLGETIATAGSLFSTEDGSTTKAVKDLGKEAEKVVDGGTNFVLGIVGKGWIWGKKEEPKPTEPIKSEKIDKKEEKKEAVSPNIPEKKEETKEAVSLNIPEKKDDKKEAVNLDVLQKNKTTKDIEELMELLEEADKKEENTNLQQNNTSTKIDKEEIDRLDNELKEISSAGPKVNISGDEELKKLLNEAKIRAEKNTSAVSLAVPEKKEETKEAVSLNIPEKTDDKKEAVSLAVPEKEEAKKDAVSLAVPEKKEDIKEEVSLAVPEKKEKPKQYKNSLEEIKDLINELEKGQEEKEKEEDKKYKLKNLLFFIR